MTAAVTDGPPSDGWTTDDLDALPDDGLRRELLDGALIVSPSPSNFHQVIAAALTMTLWETCPEHLYVTQANDVRINARRSFIPDVLVVTDEAARRGDGKYTAAEVHLAVEIVSPTSTSMDRVVKPMFYAKAGIPSYWMIELTEGLTVNTFQLEPEDGVYRPTGTFTDAIEIDQPWPIQIPLAKLRPRHL